MFPPGLVHLTSTESIANWPQSIPIHCFPSFPPPHPPMATNHLSMIFVSLLTNSFLFCLLLVACCFWLVIDEEIRNTEYGVFGCHCRAGPTPPRRLFADLLPIRRLCIINVDADKNCTTNIHNVSTESNSSFRDPPPPDIPTENKYLDFAYSLPYSQP